MKKQNSLPVVMLMTLVGCGVDENGAGKAESGGIPSVPSVLRSSDKGTVKVPPSTDSKMTVIVNSSSVKHVRARSEEDLKVLRKEVQDLAKPLEEMIKDYDHILGDTSKMQQYEGKFTDNSDAYKKKVLTLVKEQLEQGSGASER